MLPTKSYTHWSGLGIVYSVFQSRTDNDNNMFVNYYTNLIYFYEQKGSQFFYSSLSYIPCQSTAFFITIF